MGLLSPAPSTTGLALAEGTGWRNRDDQYDRKLSGAYNHSNFEFSATEANEWVSWMQYVSNLLAGGISWYKVVNRTGKSIVGPVYISGYDNSAQRLTIQPATSKTGCHGILLTSLGTDTNGIAYITGTITTNTSEYSAGTRIYLGTDRSYSREKPRVGCVQTIGFVTNQDSTTGTILFSIRTPEQIGSDQIANNAVTIKQLDEYSRAGVCLAHNNPAAKVLAANLWS